MLPWTIYGILAGMLAIAGVLCAFLWRRLLGMGHALDDKTYGASGELSRLQDDHQDLLNIIRRINEQVVVALMRVSGEAERAAGHTRETRWLDRLPVDVKQSSGWWAVLRDAEELRQAGYDVPERGQLDLSDVLRLAMDLDRKVRNVEIPLHDQMRRCQIASPQKTKWISDVLSMAQRLQHGDAEQARKLLADAIELWKTFELPTVVSILDHDPDIVMTRD